MTTINDIAKLANVSRSTVSRHLNKNGYVSQDAQVRIDKVIKETGYLPSQSAQSLRTKKTGVIGVILPKISTETASRVVEGINQVLQENNYQMLLTQTLLNKEKEIEFIPLLQARHVDGIILLATNTDDALVNEIKKAKVPVVVLGQDMPETTSIQYPDYDATKNMVNYMIEQGYRRISFIGVPEDDPAVGITRKKAYLDTLKEHQLPVKKEWIAYGDFSIPSGYEAMKTIMGAKQKPDAVFVVTDNMAVGAMQYLKENNLQLPQDMGIATTGVSRLSKYIEPILATIDFQNEQAGMAITKLLMEQLVKTDKTKKITHTYRRLPGNSL
ncbi:LacI family DNA-binding transcriptional regulator [Gracilibacillus sp. S3-1-1]|uniref:LacI family DNA-binding transcriptional regulator n=1 Tax=Gracilibacillus pellucidus TaxID=3095368 RepID=A0ACC6M0J6_9BACI|nr:LacI family DNA-binding transcriptional regulator [Gracilibacillus sp. S3-1-1]MDX8044466.1 LacI family DNA-binding transcriptional regulator [Gracilibacillus sp. S3-1-1]